MIVDLYDAIDRMLWAILAWIAIGAAIATPVLLVAAWAVTRAAKWAWRAIGPHARRGRCAPAGAPRSPSCDSSATETPPKPADGRTVDPGYEEAA